MKIWIFCYKWLKPKIFLALEAGYKIEKDGMQCTTYHGMVELVLSPFMMKKFRLAWLIVYLTGKCFCLFFAVWISLDM